MMAADDIVRPLAKRARWGVLETVFWAAAIATLFLAPSRHLILTQVAVLGLFALSLDLILGYAGILSLGHAAFFGLGAYTAGLLAVNAVMTEAFLATLVVDALASEGVAGTVLGPTDPSGVQIAKTASRSMLGHINEMTFEAQHLIAYAGGLQDATCAK